MTKGRSPRKRERTTANLPAEQPKPEVEVMERPRQAVLQLVEALRLTVAAVINLADATAEAITKRIEA